MAEPRASEPQAQTGGFKDAETLSAVDRTVQALQLRQAGYSYDVIADRLGYKSKSGAFQAVRLGLRRTLQEPADEVRKMELERLDKLQAGLWRAAIGGDTKAVASVLTIMDRRAKLLGLDAPERIDIQEPLRRWARAEGLDEDEVVRMGTHVVREHAGRLN